jgi:histidine triad (HIT) family protein
MAGQDCIFCRIIAGQIPSVRVFENDRVLAFLDIRPISDGHTLLIPKIHAGSLSECDVSVLAEMIGVVGPLGKAVVGAVQAEGYNLLCNNGRAAGQLVDHVHFHIIPRRCDDGVLARWPHKEYPAGGAEAMAEKIRRLLAIS